MRCTSRGSHPLKWNVLRGTRRVRALTAKTVRGRRQPSQKDADFVLDVKMKTPLIKKSDVFPASSGPPRICVEPGGSGLCILRYALESDPLSTDNTKLTAGGLG